jgi:UDP-2,3-diacylglucosamine hydrolase
MSYSLIISDLHLSEAHSHSTDLFLRFATDIAPRAEALFILGDLFEYWAGDDDIDDPFHLRITETLRGLDAQGTRIFIMRGNRDFLMDEELGSACNATLLDDPTLFELYGTPTLLTHGDTLCTDDTEYQRFRSMVRNSDWQRGFLSQPMATRKAQIEGMRAKSEGNKQSKAANIMDVSNEAVNELLRQYQFPRLIHGHTHRLAKHEHLVEGKTCERWVLGDWDHKANALRCDKSGIKWEVIPD